MPKDYIPAADLPFLSWAGNFKTVYTANPTGYGGTAAIATTLGTKFNTFDSALTLATNP